MFGANQPVHTLWVERHIGRVQRFRGGCVATLSLWYPPDPEQPRFDQVCRAIHLPRPVTGLARSEVGVELESRGDEDFPEAVKALVQVPDRAPDCRSAELAVALGFRSLLRKLDAEAAARPELRGLNAAPRYLATGRVDDEGRVLHVSDVLHKAVLAGRHGLGRAEPHIPEITLLLPRDNARDVEWDRADWGRVQEDFAAACGLERIALAAGRSSHAAPGQRLYLDVTGGVGSERRTCRVRFVLVGSVTEAERYLWGEEAAQRTDTLVATRLRNARIHRYRAELQGLRPTPPSRWDRALRVAAPTLAVLGLAGLLLPWDERPPVETAAAQVVETQPVAPGGAVALVVCEELNTASGAQCPEQTCPEAATPSCPPDTPAAPTAVATGSRQPAVIAAFEVRREEADSLLDFGGALRAEADRLGGSWAWAGQRARVHPDYPERAQLPRLSITLDGHACDVGALPTAGAPRAATADALSQAMTTCFDAHGTGHQPDVGDFAGWLALRPDWQAPSATARGRGDRSYLKGWQGASPRPGAQGPVTRVSALAGAVYCANRGGLAPVGAGAVTPGLRGEWRRTDSGSYVVLLAHGAVDARPPSFSSPNIGLRCRWGTP